jgi:glycogen synthase
MVFFALVTLEAFCQLQIFPSMVITNDWMCGFVSAYVKVHKYKEVFNGTKFMHIVHNLDPLYEGRLYPKYEEGDLNWLIQLPREWYLQHINNKMIINPSKCAL